MINELNKMLDLNRKINKNTDFNDLHQIAKMIDFVCGKKIIDCPNIGPPIISILHTKEKRGCSDWDYTSLRGFCLDNNTIVGRWLGALLVDFSKQDIGMSFRRDCGQWLVEGEGRGQFNESLWKSFYIWISYVAIDKGYEIEMDV
jgi:hypothetical protein